MNFKHAFKVIFIDLFSLFIGIINSFLLPKYLSIDTYAIIKTFALYVGYAGILHLGFSDGMYIILGGKNISDIKKQTIKGYFFTLIKIVSILLLLLYIISVIFIKDMIFNLFLLYTFPFQITLFISLLYRATGQFQQYVKVRLILNLFNLLSAFSVIFSNNAYVYIIVQILGYLLVSIIYSVKQLFIKEKRLKVNKNDLYTLIQTGFVIMLANTINNLIFSLDRWFVKFSYSINDFAYYSFGVSMLNLFITLISSITIIFYPYLAKENKDFIIISKIKYYILIITSFCPAGYFVLEFIVINFIKKYIPSLEVLGILILCIPFLTLINVVYANLYKVYNWGNLYLLTAVKILIICFLSNLLVVKLFNNPLNIGYATLFSLFVWYLYSSKHFKELKIKYNEIIYFVIYFLVYLILTLIECNSLLKVGIFIIIMLILNLIFYRKYLISLIKTIIYRNLKAIET